VTDPWQNIEKTSVLVFHFKNDGYLAITFSSFLMKLFLLPTERNDKIIVKKGKYFDQHIGRVSANALVVCWPTHWQCADQRVGSVSVMCRWCVDQRVGDVSADASVGSDSLPSPASVMLQSWTNCFGKCQKHEIITLTILPTQNKCETKICQLYEINHHLF